MLHPGLLERLCAARERLEDAGEDRLLVHTVAKDAGMSVFHFIRLYRAVFGETPARASQRARLNRARELLTITVRDVTDIALEVGFSSLGTFSRVFTREFGCSPTAWRKQWKGSAMPLELVPGCLTLMGWLPA